MSETTIEREEVSIAEGDFVDIFEEEPGEIYQYYLLSVHSFPSLQKPFTEQIMTHRRYEEDSAFRATADLINFLCNSDPNKTSDNLQLALDLLDRALAMELWYVVANVWNILGNIYGMMTMQEKAVECYSRVVDVEKKHGLHNLTSVSYFNLGVLHFKLDLKEKALIYFKRSKEVLMAHPPTGKRYKVRLFHTYVAMIQILCRLDNLEEAREVYESLQHIDRTEFADFYNYLYSEAEIYYAFLLYRRGLADFEDCKKAVVKARDYVNTKNVVEYVSHLSSYIFHCREAEVAYELFEDEFKALESMMPTSVVSLDTPVMEQLISYYKHKGDDKKVLDLTRDYVDVLELYVEQYKKEKIYSIEVLESFLLTDENKNEVGTKNLELKMLYSEAVKAKADLQDAYQRIDSISEIGRKLSSSLKLDEVVIFFNEMLQKHIEIDTFVLLKVDEEGGELLSLMAYQNGHPLPEIRVSCDDETSMMGKCYRTKSLVFWEEDSYTTVGRIYEEGETPMMSAVYLPLIVEDKVIGVYTVQYRTKGVYQDKLDFLKDLGPYVAIALNNALKSWSLEKEIESHIHTQEMLKEANRSLEKISQMDGLTHISSRRYFDRKINEMLERAEAKSLSLLSIMLDIDNFKLYNDTYGHLIGDDALKAVAEVFRDEMEKVGGLSARFGGEEFVGACLGLTFKEAYELGERIREGIYNLNIEHKKSPYGRLSVSVGLSYGRGMGPQAKSGLLKIADDMLYKSKNSGKNRVSIEEYNLL